MTMTLMLNASYEPLRVVSWKRAIVLVLQEKAEVLEEDDDPLRSAGLSFRMPKVIRLTRYVKVPFRRSIPLSRRALLARDDHVCAYCGGRATTMDHVLPRSRGGRHAWENLVAACSPCNGAKDDRTPEEWGRPLKFKPYAPKSTVWIVVGLSEPDPAWTPYLAAA
jgi:5-methylcytosine-specific restriction endonuclease McrA